MKSKKVIMTAIDDPIVLVGYDEDGEEFELTETTEVEDAIVNQMDFMRMNIRDELIACWKRMDKLETLLAAREEVDHNVNANERRHEDMSTRGDTKTGTDMCQEAKHEST